MSQLGIKEFANILSLLQDTRINLLRGDNQDLRLGQLLEEMKELVKHQFAQETLKIKQE